MDIRPSDDPREEIERKVKAIAAKLQDLDYALPSSPSFLGQEIYYPKRKRRLFGKLKRPQNLSSIRQEISKVKEGLK